MRWAIKESFMEKMRLKGILKIWVGFAWIKQRKGGSEYKSLEWAGGSREAGATWWAQP